MEQNVIPVAAEGANRSEAFAKTADLACAHARSGRRCTVIAAGFEEASQLKALLGQRYPGGLGPCVTTFELWLEDCWQLWGDGRQLVSPAQRLTLAWEVASKETALPGTPAAFARWMGKAAKEALPWLQERPNAPLEGAEPAAVELLRAYGGALAARGLVEESEACLFLGSGTFRDAISQNPIILAAVEEEELSFARRWLLAQLGAGSVVNLRRCAGPGSRSGELEHLQNCLFKAGGSAPLVPGGHVRVALASGKTAEPQALALCAEQALETAFSPEEFVEDADGGDGCGAPVPSVENRRYAAVFADTDPLGSFERLEGHPGLSRAAVAVSGTVSFADTYAGRFFGQWASAREGGYPAWSDLAENPLSGLDQQTVYRLSRSWAADRLLTAQDALEQLGKRSPACAAVGEQLREGGAAAAAQALASHLHGLPLSDARKGLESSALAAFRALAEQAGPQVSLEQLMELSGELRVAINWERPAAETAAAAPRGTGASTVLFATLQEAGRLPAASADTLVLAKMNRDERPSAAREDSLDVLMGKFGLSCQRDGAARLRRQLWDALGTARNTVVLERSLGDAEGETAYPCFLFQDVVDCYRADPASDSDLIGDWGVPESLAPFTAFSAETDFPLMLRGAEPMAVDQSLSLPSIGEVGASWRPYMALPKIPTDAGWVMRLSPSAIESFLSCPYLWFVQRRLYLQQVEEGFGVMERGTFVHQVMQAFYDALVQGGQPRVTPQNLEGSRALLATVFSSVAERQPQRESGRRYVAVTPWEQKQREGLLPQLSEGLFHQAALLPGFHPARHEWNYGFDQPVPYAGHFICGSIDRIDVDDQGRAVVIDYKTSLNGEYPLLGAKGVPPEGFQLPRKMQALIYSRVVEDLLGLQVVGALYFNPLNGKVEGAYDGTVLGPESIPNINPKRCCVQAAGFADFRELLETTQVMVQQRLEALFQGLIEPAPADAEACHWCPATFCERRLS